MPETSSRRTSLDAADLGWADSQCFGCASTNPQGLQIAVEEHGDGRARARFAPGEHHEGPPGHLHGGLAATALDELMGWAAHEQVAERTEGWVTGTLEVRYRRPVPLGDGPYELVAETLKASGRRKRMAARLVLGDGSTAVEAEAVFVRVPIPARDTPS